MQPVAETKAGGESVEGHAKVGAGTIWTEPIKRVSDQQDLDTTLNNIDASFPKASS